MSNPFSTPESLDPEAGVTQTPSVAQAANDLRNAAGEKAREFAHAAEDKASDIKERAVESAQSFRSTAADKAAALKATATDKAAALKATATERSQYLKGTATDQWQDKCEKAKEFQVTAEDYIRQNPTKCVVSALGLGFIVGLIVRR